MLVWRIWDSLSFFRYFATDPHGLTQTGYICSLRLGRLFDSFALVRLQLFFGHRPKILLLLSVSPAALREAIIFISRPLCSRTRRRGGDKNCIWSVVDRLSALAPPCTDNLLPFFPLSVCVRVGPWPIIVPSSLTAINHKLCAFLTPPSLSSILQELF